MARLFRPPSRDDFEIALICALPIERNAVEALLDEEYETDGFSYGKAAGDPNAYTTGRLGKQDVVLAYMPGMGPIGAAAVAAGLRSSFRSIRVGIVVGICGGVPTTASGVEILLGDVIISTSVVQIDFGRQYPNRFVRKKEVEDILGRASPEIRALVGRAEGYLVRRRLKDKTRLFSTQICAKDGFFQSVYPGPVNDVLYPAEYRHKHRMQGSRVCDDCTDQDSDVCESALQSACEDAGCDRTLSLSTERCRIRIAMGSAPDGSSLTATAIQDAQKPSIHFGRMACSSQVIKSGQHRDRIAAEEHVMGFEMESAGTWDCVPTIVIKSVCDYADSHKNKQWQGYAAATAAACTKAFLEEWRSVDKPIQARPEIPLYPSSLIPFRRDRDFVDRHILSDLWQRAFEPAARIGLVGLGGVGKTQIAIEYAYQCREANPSKWVFWVHGSSAVRFEESYKKIAERLRLPGWNEPKADILDMVSGWLSDESNGQWTMVIDNADSRDVMFEPRNGGTTTQTIVSVPLAPSSSTNHSLSDYLPLSANGSVVITSRSREVVEGLIEYGEDILDVNPMTTEEAIILLTKKLKRQERGISQDDMVRLVQQLDWMPLAITQAAAYINQRAPRITVSKYLEGLERSEIDRAKLLQQNIRDPRRDGQASNSIITTWHVSFEHIRRTRDSAAELLALMSLFDREGIPDHLLQGRYLGRDSEKESQNKNENNKDEKQFEDDITTLRAYSLISVGVSDHLFDMHRLVQFSTKKWLEIHGELTRWQGRYVSILNEAFPTGDHSNWPTCQALFPHVEVMISYRAMRDDHFKDWAAVLYRGAWYTQENGRYGVAEEMARASLAVREKVFGLDDAQTLNNVGILASVLRDQGKYEQAEEMNRRALTGKEKVLGADHPSTLTSVSNLALVLQDQGKYEQAEDMNRRVLTGSEKVLGVDHPSTLTSVSNLALLLQDQGKYEQAEEMNRRALIGREKVLGVDHPDTLTSVSNLALLLRGQGKYEQAEDMNRRVLTGSEKVLGIDHPDTLTSVSNLASVLQGQGKYEQAEEMNRRALTGKEKVLGADHPDTLTSVSNLALVLQDQGKYKQAEEMNRRVLTGSEKVLGVNHPSTLTSVSNLALVLQDQGKYEQAEEMNRRSLTGREKVLGADHPSTLTSVSNLASVLQDQGKYEQAEEMNQRSLTGREKVLGVDHPSTLTSVSNLALVLRGQGKYEQAEEMNRRMLTGCEKVLGADHPDTLTSVSNLALVLQDQGKYKQAEDMNRRVLTGSEKVLGVDHPSTLTSVSNLALVLQDQGKYERAEQMNRRSLTGREKVLGVDHPDTLTSVSNLASVLRDQGKYEQAEEINRRALTGREKMLGVDHPDTLTSVSNLALVLRDQGKYEQAEEMNRRSLTGREKVLGVDHPSTLTSVSNLALVLQDQGKYEQAEEMNQRSLTGREKVLGVDHPSTLTSVSNLALLLQDQEKYEQAEEMNRRALTGKEKVLGVDHPDTLTSVSNLASVLRDQGKYEQAEEMNRWALTGREKMLGVDHPDTLTSVSNLALVLRGQGKYEQAEEINRRSLMGREKVLRVDYPYR